MAHDEQSETSLSATGKESTTLNADSTPPNTKIRARSSMLVKMSLFVAALLILTAGLMSWAGYVVARNIIRDQIHERLRVAASDRHAMVMSFVSQQLERAGLVASRTRLRNLVAEYEHGDISSAEMLKGTRPIIEDALRSTDGFLVISIADPEGRILTSTSNDQLEKNVSEEPAFQAGLKRRHLGEPRFEDGVFVTSVAAPALTNDQELLGVVLVDLDVTPLFEILTDTEGLGETGEVLVGTRVDSDVHYLFGSRKGTIRRASLGTVRPMAAAIGGATQSEVTDYAGIEVLVHYRPIEYQPLDYQPWGLIAKMDVAEAYEPLETFRRTRIQIQLGLVALGLAGSFWLSRRMTRPICDLTQTATAVASGDLATQVVVTSDDEIGTLGHTFNAMTRELQSTYATLEDRVRQRTAELQSEIARREEIQNELEQNAERIKRIIDTANDAFISMDASGQIVEWNPQAQAMFGWSRDEVLKLSVSETIIPESFREKHQEGLNKFLATREAVLLNRRLELTALRRDGSEFPVEITITPQRLGENFVFNAFLHDITQRKLDEQTLHEARESAEAANKSKSEFLANMSHEIRTPMNGIIGMGELLAGTRLEPVQRDYLNMVRQSADSLLRLLNDILDFSKIEAGKLELETIPFSLRDCIGNTGHTLASRASDKGIELACRIAPEIPDILIGDPGRLRQILVNLAGNAIKFTEDGEVVVEVNPVSTLSVQKTTSGIQHNGECIELRIDVRDTGIGIPVEKQKSIFDAFGQADASTTRRYGGTGLGLAISTQLVEMMNGSIDVDSKVGVGTTFSFTVRFHVSAEQKLRPPSELAELRGMSVLIVDDNATNRRILCEILESWKMRPTAVESGDAGLEYVQQARANGEAIPLVLLDCMMPSMDGFEFAKRLRETVPEDECTVIMISSGIQAGDTERCQQLRIARCMPKPVMHSELLNTILSGIHSEQPFTEQSNEPETDSTVEPRRILLVEDGLINQRVATEFLIQRGHQVVVAGDGKLALEAIDREPFDIVLMDVQMPVMDGFAATKAIRRKEEGTARHLPIIAMTANAMKGDRERCLEAGMDDYIAKPVEAARLYEAVESVSARWHAPTSGNTTGEQPSLSLGDSETNQPQCEVASSSETKSFDSSAPLIDWSAAMKSMPGGKDVAIDLAELLLVEAPKLVDQIRAAQKEQNAETFRRAAHTLKGSVAIFSITWLVEICEKIESLARAEKFAAAESLVEELIASVSRMMVELEAFIQAK